MQFGIESEHRNGDYFSVRRNEERSFTPEMCQDYCPALAAGEVVVQVALIVVLAQ